MSPLKVANVCHMNALISIIIVIACSARPSTAWTTSLLRRSPFPSPLSALPETLLDDSTLLPRVHIGARLGSGSYGTVHECRLIRPDSDTLKCVAKRHWSLRELEAGVPESIGDQSRTSVATKKDAHSQTTSLEVKARAERCKHYWEVERHCFQKLEQSKEKQQRFQQTAADGQTVLLDQAIPKFLGVYGDDGSGMKGADSSYLILGYGELEDKSQRDNLNGWLSKHGDEQGEAKPDLSHQWMVFEFVGAGSNEKGAIGTHEKNCALTLLDAMEIEWKHQHLEQTENNVQHHTLYNVQKALNLPESFAFGDVLDTIIRSLLENLKKIHAHNIIHRDVKPGNLLCDAQNKRLRLIDFGSAADLDPSPIPPSNSLKDTFVTMLAGGNSRIGLDEGIVALSPIYAAPEMFVKLNENPLSFDVFSAALIICQLLFNLLDERTDAGFHQRLKDVSYDLDVWLETELGAKLRPGRFDSALEYLGERRGLWGLLKKMFQSDPMKRISSVDALNSFNEVMSLKDGIIEWSDPIIVKVAREEAYFETVIDSFERCAVNMNVIGIDNDEDRDLKEMPRPLHFLASFKRNIPMGLLLAEATEFNTNDGSMSDMEWNKWKFATRQSFPGEVFVRGWTSGGQADNLGIFEVGDRLRGVGELPFVDGGFEAALTLIERQPQSGSTLKLHFDRFPLPRRESNSKYIVHERDITRVTDQGAWKSKGRRNSQEDTFILHEVQNSNIGDVLICGVFDGHGGTAASETVSRIVPPLFSDELESTNNITESLEKCWQIASDSYRNGCDENGECVAEYHPTEGILFAQTGSKDLVAGTTATMVAISLSSSGTNEVAILNCGDSRTILIGEVKSADEDESVIAFHTRDHSPDDEMEIKRLELGKDMGLGYSIPECSMSSSYMRIGDYQYALCRSLEGSFVTSKGIVSDPDITTLNLSKILVERQHCAFVLACDGLFEVMSNEEVGQEVIRLRKEGYKAGEVAKNLCGQALKKGSYDNISIIVVYLDIL